MAEVGNNENALSVVMSKMQGMVSEVQKTSREISDRLNQLSNESEENKKIAERNHADNRDKLQSIVDLISSFHPDPVMEIKDSVGSNGLASSLSLNNSKTVNSPEIGKSFVLRHVFKNVENFEVGRGNFSKTEEHFGVKGYICLTHKNNNLAFYLHVEHPGEDWEIETENELKIIGPIKSNRTRPMNHCFKENTGQGCGEFLKWEEMMKNYLVDGNLTAEAHVKIIETKGLGKEKFRSFDESVKEVSDIVLVVKDRRFYVLKKYLAAQSSFFKALFLGNFAESKKSEVTLTGIDPEDFHFFLEVLYGELAIDENNVEGIALLADMYDAPTAIRRCENFLKSNSKKSLKRKLHMATSYNLEGLKKQCLDNITTADEIRSVVPINIQELDPTVTTDLLKKALSLLT